MKNYKKYKTVSGKYLIFGFPYKEHNAVCQVGFDLAIDADEYVKALDNAFKAGEESKALKIRKALGIKK